MKKVILASQSPRRKDLLAQMGVEFVSVPSQFDERLNDKQNPRDVAIELAKGKAMEVSIQYPDRFVIGSDTIVALNNKQFGKPADKEEAHSMLRQLSGKAHEVITAIVIVNREEGMMLSGVDSTRVCFKPYDEKIVTQYVFTGDSLDKAGAYGIQSGAAHLISHIEGNYDTVVGLPTKLLADLLAEAGIRASPVKLDMPAVLSRG